MKEIGPGIYIETNYPLVTVGAVLTSEGWVCIDTPSYPRDARSWRIALQAISDQPICYVINTDHHRDRILNNSWFEAPVVAHAVSAEVMLNLKGAFLSQAAEEMSTNDNELVEIASLKIVPPQISYTSTLRLYCGDREIVLSHKPSATSGNSWVIVADARVIFIGDMLVVNQHPYVSDGLTKPWIDSLRFLRLERYAGWTIVPGRGDIIPLAESGRLSEYLRVARRRVKSLLHSGRPRSEVALLIPEFLPFFPYDPGKREEIQRRIKATLEAIYEELQTSQDDDAETE